MDVLVSAPSRCRHVHGPRAWRATTSCTSTPSPTPSLEEHTQRNQPVRVGRVYPNHPAALRLGTQMGSDSPGQHEYIFSTKLMHCSRKPYETHPRGEVRVAAAMPEGHCGGFGTSARMRCGTLKRLGTRQRRPDDQGHRQLGSHSKSTTAIFSAPTGRLGCRRDSTRAPGERRPPAGTPIKPSSRGPGRRQLPKPH